VALIAIFWAPTVRAATKRVPAGEAARTPYSPGIQQTKSGQEDWSGIEAVITTELGPIRLEFFGDKAPKHVQQFIKLARSGFYDGSAFFRVMPMAIIQGGDPMLKSQSTPRDRWGTGGLNQVPDEPSDLKHLRGTISTVAVPGKPDSGGAQFFICASPQPQLDGQFSAFGRVTEGIDVVDKISVAAADDKQLTITPVRIISVKIEPKRVAPFKDASVLETKKGCAAAHEPGRHHDSNGARPRS
jgi:cyclophilin family peptidyl-prolyl cis-trans isomerase